MDYIIYFLGVGIGFSLGVYWSVKYYSKKLEELMEKGVEELNG